MAGALARALAGAMARALAGALARAPATHLPANPLHMGQEALPEALGAELVITPKEILVNQSFIYHQDLLFVRISQNKS